MNANTNDIGSHFNRPGVSHIEGVLTALNPERRGLQPPSQPAPVCSHIPGLCWYVLGVADVGLIPLHSDEMETKIILF